ncbi:MAG TPA: glycogen debranching N-terminal domain-containing protein [Ktedonobacterales bacterium]
MTRSLDGAAPATPQPQPQSQPQSLDAQPAPAATRTRPHHPLSTRERGTGDEVHSPHLGMRARADCHDVFSGHSLLITNLDGDVTSAKTEGYYYESTRLLSRFCLFEGDKLLRSVIASPVEGSGFLAYRMLPEAEGVPYRSVYATDARALGDGLLVRLALENYAPHVTARCTLRIELAADFRDIMEVSKGFRAQAANVSAQWDEARRELTFRYHHLRLDRAVAVRLGRVEGDGLRGVQLVQQGNGEIGAGPLCSLELDLALAPHAPVVLHVTVEPIFDGRRLPAPERVFDASATALGRLRAELRAQVPRLTTPNPSVARAWAAATESLVDLTLGQEPGPAAPAAGIPLYLQFFGRDSLTITWQELLALQRPLRDALRVNAGLRGTIVENWLDEEPGKLIHQQRFGPLSVAGDDPFLRYYGDYATPPDFLIMLGQYLAWTNDLETVRALLPAARTTIDWLDRYGDLDGDLDGDGFIEYVTRSSQGTKNQGWKDSSQGIVDEQGYIVPNPIAPVEIQGWWYVGLRWAAAAFFFAGDRAYALELLAAAHRLKQRFNQAYWMPDEQFYAMALGPDKQQVRSIGGAAGHLLATGVVPRERAPLVARRLLQPDLFSGWGVRTLSSEHPAYNPFGYHLGAVWPVDMGTFTFGLARYGCFDEMFQLAEGLFAASDLFSRNLLPEVLGGIPRDADHPHPGIYPDANEPQGWSSSAVVMVVQALLGLIPFAPLRLLLVDPHLPPWLPYLRLEGIRVGKATVDLEAWRDERSGKTHYRCQRSGPVVVLRQPVPSGPENTPLRAALAALTSLPGNFF